MDGTGRGILPWTTDIVFNLYQYGANRWNGQVDTATAATTKTAAATTTASTHLPTNSSIASGSTWITARGGVINQVTGSVQSIHSEDKSTLSTGFQHDDGPELFKIEPTYLPKELKPSDDEDIIQLGFCPGGGVIRLSRRLGNRVYLFEPKANKTGASRVELIWSENNEPDLPLFYDAGHNYLYSGKENPQSKVPYSLSCSDLDKGLRTTITIPESFYTMGAIQDINQELVMIMFCIEHVQKEGYCRPLISILSMKIGSRMSKQPRLLGSFEDRYMGIKRLSNPNLSHLLWSISRDQDWIAVYRIASEEEDERKVLTVFHIETGNGQNLEFNGGDFDVSTIMVDGLIENHVAWLTFQTGKIDDHLRVAFISFRLGERLIFYVVDVVSGFLLQKLACHGYHGESSGKLFTLLLHEISPHSYPIMGEDIQGKLVLLRPVIQDLPALRQIQTELLRNHED